MRHVSKTAGPAGLPLGTQKKGTEHDIQNAEGCTGSMADARHVGRDFVGHHGRRSHSHSLSWIITMVKIMKVRAFARLKCLGLCISILTVAMAAQSRDATAVELESWAKVAAIGHPVLPDIAARSGGGVSTKRGGR